MQTQLNTARNIHTFVPPKGVAGAGEFIQSTPLKTFEHEFDTYLKDSNAYTNIYFSRYFEWQGICRECWLQREISRDLLRNEGILITKQAYNDYIKETFPFQTVLCHLNTYDVKQCSVTLLFNFYVEGDLVSKGYQKIILVNHNRRITKIPEFILKKVRQYEIRRLT